VTAPVVGADAVAGEVRGEPLLRVRDLRVTFGPRA
jgi:hypothetical protein